jgi:hypothetical protein
VHLEYCVQRPQTVIVDPLVVLVLKVAGTVGGFALFAYVLCRLVSGGRKIGPETGAQIVGIFVMLFGPDIAPRPSREVVTESREQGESGDPPNPDPTEPTEPTGTKAE